MYFRPELGALAIKPNVSSAIAFRKFPPKLLSSFSRHSVARPSSGTAMQNHDIKASSSLYFLPLFLMPWPPVLRGPLPPALAASSFRAFSSALFFSR